MKRILQPIIFFGILAVFLYIGNSVIYDSLAIIFSITAWAKLATLGVVLGILSASFIISSIIGGKYYNRVSRVYYTLSAVWIGFFVYLFLASFIYGVLVMISSELLRETGAVLTFIALLVGLYGVIHGRRIYLVEISLSLPHLPESWRGRKAVWISDLHLGQVHGASFAEKIVERVNGLSPDIVFIGGDLFDGTKAPDLEQLIIPLKKMKAPLGIFFITGNHEEFNTSEEFLSAVRATGIRILQDGVIDVDGVQVIGVDYHNASTKDRFEKILSGLDIKHDRPSILLKHEPKDIDVAEKAGISLQISGHTHRGQLWPVEIIVWLLYRRFTYGLKRAGDTQVYTSSGVGTWGPPMRVGNDNEIVVFTFI